MPVGVLLVSHPGIGSALLSVASQLLRRLPMAVEAFEVGFGDDPDAVLPAASAALRRVDGGVGVLVLTDLYGATPANVASRLARLGTPVRRVSGLSLPMLLRVLNYPDKPLDELAEVAACGGRGGICIDKV